MRKLGTVVMRSVKVESMKQQKLTILVTRVILKNGTKLLLERNYL